ncbi:M24 family metallopeptidase [Cumulibacter manganitolerans]|uniref:M24 family metallopeptidase n=1 Tax=Cumulibacter manganitolerans TaxID=1884992 RepID=UPI00129734AD|nr:Xaa-Pro peptidase family protein [Cumulibacter manganitolerans]
MTTTGELQARLARCREQTAAGGFAAFVAGPGAELRYLCGHDVHLNERLTALIVPADGDPVLLTPVLERSLALASPVADLGLDVLAWAETEDPYPLIAGLVPGGRVAVSERMWAQHVFGLQRAGLRVTGGGALMSALRAVKSAEEVASLRAAARAIDSVHAGIERWLRPGRTETAVAADLHAAIRDAGHAQVDFVIVASGPHGANPHHEPGDRAVEAGDMVVVDIGGTMPDGYCSDSTRTYVVGGDPSKEMTAMYDVLRAAQQAARDTVRAGVSAERVDAAARDVITAGGYGAAFIHRTGHGIGLETHEEPYIVGGNHAPLAAGSAFSIEPGIYLDGRFGARIEDIVVATGTGIDVLNATTRELRVVG